MAAQTPFRFRPARRRFPAQHRVFEEGDVQRHLQLQALRGPLEHRERARPPRAPAEMGCEFPGCAQTFASLRAYELHYQARHRQACSACGRPAPSAHLLGLHLLEQHQDALFLLAARRAPAFQCLLESCPQRFRSSRARKEHLERVHRYPPDFRFAEPAEAPGSSSTKPARPPPQDGVVFMDTDTEASEQEPGEAMETSCTGNAAEDPSQPAMKSISSSQRWLYRTRIPPTICFGQGAPRGFGGQSKET